MIVLHVNIFINNFQWRMTAKCKDYFLIVLLCTFNLRACDSRAIPICCTFISLVHTQFLSFTFSLIYFVNFIVKLKVLAH